MFVTRRRYEREMQALYGQILRLRHERDTAREAHDSAHGALLRLHGRNQHLADLLDLAREAQDEAGFERLMGRLHRALRAVARYRRELAAQHRVNDRLSDQLMGALGYTDAGLRELGLAIRHRATTTTTQEK